jgi:hypothetical protein
MEYSLDSFMNIKLRWRQNATAIACTDSRTERFRVRELRQARRHSHARKAEEENRTGKETKEAEQAKSLAFSLSASLAFRSLSLVLFVGEPIPSQTASSHLTAHDSEALPIRELASVVAEALLVKITEQVIGFHADVRALKLSLHQAPEVLHRVRMNIAVCVLYGVIHNRVPILRIKPVVRLQSVTEESATRLYVLLNVLVKFMLPAIRNSEGEDLAAALHHSQSDGLILAPRAGNNLLTACAVHIARFAADERFIYFDFARQFRSGLILHRFANAVKHEPSGLLGQSEVARDFVAAHTILAVGNKPHSREPLAQRDRRFIEDRTDFNGELFPAFRSAALPNSARLEEHRFLCLAVRALQAIGPALARKIVQSVVGIVEVNNRFGQCFGAFHA